MSEPIKMRTLAERVVEVLKRNPGGLKAGQIAFRLGIDRPSLNWELYNNSTLRPLLYKIPGDPIWTLNP